MEKESLKHISSSGQTFKGYALVRDVQSRVTVNGAPFLNISLSEKETTIDCKLWDRHFNGYSAEELKNIFFVIGDLVYVEGSVGEYRSNLQLTVTNFSTTDKSGLNIDDFVQSAPEVLTKMCEELEGFIKEINSSILNKITNELYLEHKELFITHPAAKSNHHDFRSGLLYHTLSMLRLSEGICDQYKEINKDIVYSAIILHDIGKVVELTGYLSPNYTKVGNLLGHITIANMFIDRKMESLKKNLEHWSKKDFEQIYELMHVVSAQHGKLEYGSPVVPKTLEAEVVHQIDMLDSRINMITSGLRNADKEKDELIKVYPIGYYYNT